MPWSPLPVASGSHEDDDGLCRNPWTDTTIGHSSSHVADPDSQSPAKDSIRQRRPLRRHIRSQTTSGDPLCSPSGLSDGSSYDDDDRERRGASLDLHETRPSLKRVINTSRKTFDTARPVGVNEGSRTRKGKNSAAAQTEEEVIVHKIQPGDSLPGVALKYNVSLATLRNANKLWANDTIHLRQVLYIPTQAITSSKTNSVSLVSRVRPEYPTPEVQTGTFPRTHRSHHDSVAPSTISTGSASATIKRVPLSELSFFPPSSTSALSSSSSPKSLVPIPIPPKSIHTGIPPPSPFANFSLRGASTFGLAATLLNGAKDEIISRLSLDSTRGSSDAASEEHHDNVELEEVVRGPRRARRRRSVIDDNDDGEWIPPQPTNGVAFAMHAVEEQDSVVLNTPRKPKVIRTVQLQPSPTMVIPASN